MCSDMIVPCAACLVLFFFFNDTATTEIYTLSLHDALPIWPKWRRLPCEQQLNMGQSVLRDGRAPFRRDGRWPPLPSADRKGVGFRSPNPEWRRWAPRGVQCGNATDPGEAGGSPGESSQIGRAHV